MSALDVVAIRLNQKRRSAIRTFGVVGLSAVLAACGAREQEVYDGKEPAPDSEVIKQAEETEFPRQQSALQLQKKRARGTRTDQNGATYFEKELVVGLLPGVDAAGLQAALGPYAISVEGAGTLLDVELGYLRLVLPSELDEERVREILEELALTRSVERHYLYQLNVVPNDPDYQRLWGLEKIGAPFAWEQGTGSRTVSVMVLDTGTDLDHPDLLENLGGLEFDTQDEFPGDTLGWDFVRGNNVPEDTYGHGTHVAGTIGAVGSNGRAVTGVNWNVEIVTGRVCDGSGCSTWSVAQGLIYAAKRGVRVVNMSLGGYHPELSYEKDALNRFGEAGGLVVAAAGNDGRDTDVYAHYPSSYTMDFIVSVAASDEEDRLASFSNYGRNSVDLAAPGTNIISTLPGGGIGAKSGTSMASPHVAGAAALYLSQYPGSTASEVRDYLIESTQKLASLNRKMVSGGRLDLGALTHLAPSNRCGDGIVRDDEACDDGNAEPWDGCSPTCQWEPTCAQAGGACGSRCGDGMTLPGDEEGCDDGNTQSGDGCSATCQVEGGFTCETSGAELPASWNVPVVYRDFNRSPKSGGVKHTDFETFSGKDRTTGLVGVTLDANDGLPVYTGRCESGSNSGCPQGPQTSSKQLFDSWFRDDPSINHRLVSVMTLNKTNDDSYVFQPEQLFPVDGFGFVKSGQENASAGHNFGFTTELRGWFSYVGGERLEFSGDDDVWVFINGKLALDLGGLHPERRGAVELHGSQACEDVVLEGAGFAQPIRTCRTLGLVEGHVYEIALFHAERHTNQSNFNLTMRGFVKNTSVCEATPCPPGYEGQGLDCTDKNECQTGNNDCDGNAECENTQGSYLCHCPHGMIGDGIHCSDRDECEDGSQTCPDAASCVNLVGTYRCDGGDPTFPAPDIDECALRLDSCDENATCTNTDGSYTCRCNEGYLGNGFFCGDTNECTPSLNRCDSHATCTNFAGSFTCACDVGWQGDGFACGDENECETGTAECDANANCENLVGSYDCRCQEGFEGDGLICWDRDECARNLDDCGPHSDCKNEPGSFSCACSAGYEGDGYSCTLIPSPGTGGASGAGGGSPGAGGGGASAGAGGASGAGGDQSTGGSAAAGGAPASGGSGGNEGTGAAAGSGGAPGSGGETSAGGAPGSGGDSATGGASAAGGSPGAGGISGDGGAAAGGAPADGGGSAAGGSSQAGGGSPSTGGASQVVTCDIENPCAHDASCSDGESGPECTCHDGFVGDGLSCDDVDECAFGTDSCDDDASCQNAWGGYYCTCNPGYYGDGESCLLNPGFVEKVATSSDHTCALLEGGSVRCWGFNEYGQLGYGDTEGIGDDERADARGYVAIGAEVVQIEPGFAHTCALTRSGQVACWGRNHYGQLGYGHLSDIGDDELPISAGFVNVGGTVTQIAAGGEHTCALLDTGAVRCWGLGIDGQLGYGNTRNIGDNESPATAGDVPLGKRATRITAGRDHTCAIVQGGELMCWGRGLWAPLGYGNTRNVGDNETPASVGSVNLGAPAVEIDAGWYHTCAIVETQGVRSLRCFGYGGVGQLGYASTQSIGDNDTPADWGDVQLGYQPQTVAAGLYHTCVTNLIGEATCFGYSLYGRLGYADGVDIGDDEHPRNWAKVQVGSRIISLSAGTEHTCAALNSGDVRCWGSNAYAQLGTGNSNDIGDDEYPDGNVPILSADVDECLLGTHSCDPVAICDDLQPGFRCTCPRGYRGDGFSCFALANVVLTVEAGSQHSCAIVTTGAEYAAGAQSGEVRCWGEGDSGRLGLGNTHDIGDNEFPRDALAVRLPERAKALALGGSHTCALLESGNVSCFGNGMNGQLGLGVKMILGDNEHPDTVASLNIGGAVAQLVAGEDHTCARLESGAVRCWGEGDVGRLGYGNTNDIGDNEAPADAGNVPLGGVALEITAGRYHTCALIADQLGAPGGIRCWGAGVNGRLGNQSSATIGDNELPASVPFVAVGGQAVALSAGERHTCALMVDGTARCFGYGFHGALGYGNAETIGDNEPAYAGGLIGFSGPIVELSAGDNHTCARLGDGVGDSASVAGNIHCWGYGLNGALGLGNNKNVGDITHASLSPAVEVSGYVLHVTSGGAHTCAQMSDGVRCFGSSTSGQLGYGNKSSIGLVDKPSAHGLVQLFASEN